MRMSEPNGSLISWPTTTPYTGERMPLFKRREEDAKAGDGSPKALARILSIEDIFDRLEEEIVRVQRYGGALSVFAITPQRLANALDEREGASASEFVRTQLRFNDLVSVMTDGTVVAILPETEFDGARVVAHRIASDLTVRSTAERHRKWLSGVSAFPTDGEDPPALMQSAIDRAQHPG